MRLNIAAPLAAVLIAVAATPQIAVARPAPTWDNLIRVPSRKLDNVYLLPGADFRPYTKVMIDPAEVAFKRGWLKDYNASARNPSARISDQDGRRMLQTAREGFDQVIREAFWDAGYQVVTEAGPDVLRVSPTVFDLVVTAPDTQTAGRSTTWSVEAGEASVAVEARDSSTGAVLGRAVDQRTLDDSMMRQRSSVSNRADFERLFRSWSKTFVDGVAHLKELSPINASGRTAR